MSGNSTSPERQRKENPGTSFSSIAEIMQASQERPKDRKFVAAA
jgi:hypothetical protein